MADETIETTVYWGKWRCTRCDIVLSAEPPPGEQQPICPGCNSPRTDADPIFDDNEFNAETNEAINPNIADTVEEIAIAMNGPDWTCERCGGKNRAAKTKCFGCQAPKPDEKPLYRRKTSEEKFQELGEVARRNVEKIDAMQQEYERIQPKVQPLPSYSQSYSQPGPSPIRTLLIAGAAGLGLLVISSALVWGCSSHLVDAEVSSTSWQYSIDKDTFVPATGQDWQENIFPSPSIMPVNGHGEHPGAQILQCEIRQHGVNHHSCGTTVVCDAADNDDLSLGVEILFGAKSCSKKSNGNGSYTQTCITTPDPKPAPVSRPSTPSLRPSYSAPSPKPAPKRSNSIRYTPPAPSPRAPTPPPEPVCYNKTLYCDDPVYDNWCSYSTYQWVFNDSYQSGGRNAKSAAELTWPNASTGPLDRLSYTEKYRVDVTSKDGDTFVLPTNRDDYLSWQPGQKVHVRVTNFGFITGVEK